MLIAHVDIAVMIHFSYIMQHILMCERKHSYAIDAECMALKE